MKNLYKLQIISLVIGTLFAWYTVVNDFLRFFDVEGTIFRIKDCVFPNPVTTPCFWGAWAFLAALIWAIYIYRQHGSKRVKQQKNLLWLLIGGTIFAWSNMTYLIFKFYSTPAGEPTIGCSGQVVTSPFTTPCFIGAVLFLLSLIVGIIVTLKAVKSSKDQVGPSQPDNK